MEVREGWDQVMQFAIVGVETKIEKMEKTRAFQLRAVDQCGFGCCLIIVRVYLAE